MGRTNGRLIPFLKDGLEEESFLNLKWVNKDYQIFSLSLPRYEKRKDLKLYEAILIKWCFINNRKYSGYSAEKAVIQAALRKSVYLVSLKFIDNDNFQHLHFRFASKEEAKEKRRLQKEKAKSKEIVHETHDSQPVFKGSDMPLKCESNFSFPSVPSPNPSLSSGYGSGNEDIGEKMQASEESDLTNSDLFNSILENPEMFLGTDTLNDIIGYNDETAPVGGAMFGNCEEAIPSDIFDNREAVSLAAVIGNTEEILKSDDNELSELLQSSNETQDLVKPVVDITTTMINFSASLRTYWLCTRKLYVDATLLLICEKQVIEENQEVVPGQIVIPNNVFEPGDSYNLKAKFELDGKYFLFLLPNY